MCDWRVVAQFTQCWHFGGGNSLTACPMCSSSEFQQPMVAKLPSIHCLLGLPWTNTLGFLMDIFCHFGDNNILELKYLLHFRMICIHPSPACNKCVVRANAPNEQNRSSCLFELFACAHRYFQGVWEMMGSEEMSE